MDKAAEHTEKPQEQKEVTSHKEVVPKTAAPAYLHTDAEGKTKGEKIFDKSVYLGLNYFINLAASVGITYYFMESKIGKPKMEWAAEKMGDAASSFMTKKQSKSLIEYFGLTSGGTILTLPMMWMENRKKKLVYWLNTKFAPDTIAGDDPNAKKSLTDILNTSELELPATSLEQPKQTLGNALWRRGLGMGLVFGWGQAIERTYTNDRLKEHISTVADKAIDLTGIQALQTLNQKPLTKLFTQWTVMDALNTGITAGVSYLTNGAKKHKNGKNGSEEEEAITAKPVTSPTDALPPAEPEQSAIVPAESPASPQPLLSQLSSVTSNEQAERKLGSDEKWQPSSSFVDSIQKQPDVSPTLAV